MKHKRNAVFLNARSSKLEAHKGFSAVEVLIVLAIIVVIGVVLILGLNPSKRFTQARNAERKSDLNAIMNAIQQRTLDTKGVFETGCSAGAIPTSTKKMADNNPAAGDYDVAPCFIPTYLGVMPYDPTATGAHYATTTDYDTGYTIVRDATSGRITITAPSAELGESISVAR